MDDHLFFDTSNKNFYALAMFLKQDDLTAYNILIKSEYLYLTGCN